MQVVILLPKVELDVNLDQCNSVFRDLLYTFLMHQQKWHHYQISPMGPKEQEHMRCMVELSQCRGKIMDRMQESSSS